MKSLIGLIIALIGAGIIYFSMRAGNAFNNFLILYLGYIMFIVGIIILAMRLKKWGES